MRSRPTWNSPSERLSRRGSRPNKLAATRSALRRRRARQGGAPRQPRGAWIETFWRDLRHGLGGLARDPGFAVVAVGALALGIGANTAMFSLVDATLLRPLPFPEPSASCVSGRCSAGADQRDQHDGLSRLEAAQYFLRGSCGLGWGGVAYRRGRSHPPERRLRSPNYFEVFGVGAARGRTFAPDEDQPTAEPAVILSHATWQNVFGGDPDIIGRRIALDQAKTTVIGVLPAGSFDRGRAQLWKPLVFTPGRMNRGYHWLRSVARLKSGVTLEQAQQEMSEIDASLTDLTPTWKRDWGVLVEPYDTRLIDDNLRRSIQVDLGAVALVLLIACANAANLLLAKGVARRKEMAVRAALGASRGRLTVQLFAESLALCLLGGASGIALAQLLIQGATPLIADSLPYTAEVGLDARVLGFSAAAALGVSLLVGVLPSFRTSFTRLASSMNQQSRGSSDSREALRRAIVTGEVAVSLVLICGALLLLKSLAKLQEVDAGVRVGDVITHVD